MAENQTGILNSEQCPQFFKIYMPQYCSTQLRIPPAFLKYFEGCLPLKFILVTSAKKSWEVDTNKVDDDVYFKTGWENFVQDNSLEFGDFLIFYYNSGSKFYVSIFGKNNCLKEIKAANNHTEKQPTHIQDNEIIEKHKTGEQKRSCVEDDKLSFEVKIHPSYVDITKGFLNLPVVWIKGIKECRSMAKLQHSGRIWDLKVARYGERIRFIDGWSKFAVDNCLAVGDVCSFKMIDINPEFYLLDVSIFREL